MKLRRPRSCLLALTALAAGTGALAAAQAGAAPIVGTPTHAPGSYYVLKSARSRCKAHYTRETVTIRTRRHGKLVKARQLRCVYGVSAAGRSGGSGAGAGPGFPVDLPTATITVTVLPTAADHTYITSAGNPIDVGGNGVLANATGTGLSAALVSGPASGTLSLNRDGSFDYTPPPGGSGIEDFVYRATSSDGESSQPAKVTLEVTPVAVDSLYAVSAGQTLTIPAGGLLAGDIGTGLTADLVSGPNDGSLTLNPDGSASYTPASTFSGADSFSYQAVDGNAQHSNTATVTINVGSQPPSVVPETFSGAIANTELQIGGSGGTGPEVYQGTTSALAGDSDPNGGTLSVTPGTIATAQGGSVTIASNGDFTYQPPAGFTGPSDSFSYTVDESEGLSTPATATIDFNSGDQLVWYVDDTVGANGSGTSASPFKTLAAAAAAAGPGDVIYVEASSTPYDGGITLERNARLIGAGAALVVDGVTLLNPAGSSTLTNTSTNGVGVTLAEGDSVSGVAVNGTHGAGIVASGVDAFTLDSTVSISGAQGDGLDISGGSGAIADAAPISGAAGHSLVISGRTGGTVAVSGAITDTQADGGGIDLANDGGATVSFTGQIRISTGAQEAFDATGGGTVTATSTSSTLTTTSARALDVETPTAIGSLGLSFQAISASSPADDGILINAPVAGGGLDVLGTGTVGTGGTIQNAGADAVRVTGTASLRLSSMDIVGPAGNGVYASNVPSLTVNGLSITGAGADGIDDTGDGTVTQDLGITGNTISGQRDAGISITSPAGGNGFQGLVTGNQIGVAGTLGSGSLDGDGIDLSAASGGTLIVAVNNNTIDDIAVGTGVFATAGGASSNLQLEFDGNAVTMDGSGSQDGVTVTETGSSASTAVCVDPEGNALRSAASGAYDLALEQTDTGATFAVGGYTAGSVPTFIFGENPGLFHGASGVFTTATTFSGGSCTSPTTGNN